MSNIGDPIEWDSEGNAVEWECLDSRCRTVLGVDGRTYVQTRDGTYIIASAGARNLTAGSFDLYNPEIADNSVTSAKFEDNAVTAGAENLTTDSFVLDGPDRIWPNEEAPSENLKVGLSNNFPSTPLQVVGENPKDRIGVKKPNLHLVPSTAIVHCAKAMEDGAAKYGPYNWRENKVIASVYVSAAERHLRQWFDGEDEAEDSGQHHLAHAMACLAILLDAQEGKNLKDDRPFPGETSELIKRLTKTD